MTAETSPDALSLEGVIAFLLGTKNLGGEWFGEPVEGRPAYWWREPLAAAWRSHNAAAPDVGEPAAAIERVEDWLDGLAHHLYEPDTDLRLIIAAAKGAGAFLVPEVLP